MPDSTFFRSAVDKLYARRVSIVDLSTEFYEEMPALHKVCNEIVHRMDQLFTLTAAACKEAAAISSPVSAMPAPAAAMSSDRDALKIELPNFDGDPFKWSNFKTMFTQTVSKRARGHSPLEVKGLLIKAVKHQEGLKILHNLPSDDMTLDEMLARLEAIYGSPEILAPLIIGKIKSVSSCSLTACDIDDLYEKVILPYNKFCSLVGDSLGAYLALSVSHMMTPECRREWLRHRPGDKPPDMDNLQKFVDYQKKELRGVCTQASELPNSTHSSASPSSARFDRPKPPSSKPSSPRRSTQSHCPLCGELHSLGRCSTFSSYDVDKRNKTVRDKKLCLNCLGEGHGCRTCPSRFACRTCGGRHHTLLHRERETSTNPTTSAAVLTSRVDTPTRGVASLYSAMVAFQCGRRTVMARALLDAGASLSMITENLANNLGLTRIHDPIHISGIAGTTNCNFVVKSDLLSVDSRFKLNGVTFTVIPRLEPARKPEKALQILNTPELRHYSLADPDLGGRVDIILGVTETSAITTGTPFKVGDLLALPTQLGLCLSCPLESYVCPTVNTVITTPTIDTPNDIAKLWELDQVPDTPSLTNDETSALEQFEATCKLGKGRYSVSMPRTSSPPDLGDSRRQALSRLHANEKTLQKHGRLFDFQEVVREYVTLNHAEEVPPHELSRPSYYMPVHAVLKESSTSTRLRAVFDASARTSTGASLNDQLLPGPSLYPPLPDVLIRFRCHASAISADISKMFREIMLNAEERDWHRFLMRAEDDKIKDMRMLRLTFGVKSSPFLATQVLRRHANDHLETHPTASRTILTDFYVDDLLSGAPTTKLAHDMFTELRELCSSAGMNLRKWRTNDRKLRDLIPEELLESDECTFTPSAPKALGVHWDTTTDVLHVATPTLTPDLKATKRVIASITAGVFDVLGLFAPVIIAARILFQDTWRRSLTWDEEIPDDLRQRWRDWIDDLPVIHQHPVPRLTPINPETTTLHGFCDASSVAYGAVIYARTGPPGNLSTSLILAKARVLPTKPLTIPKAELCGALLLAKLLTKTLKLLHLPSDHAYAWTDSQIVLYWLPKSPSSLNRFVANRVATIQELLPCNHWNHVSTAENPADLTSRGVRAQVLTSSQLWWHGPDWLLLSKEHWPPPFLSRPSVPIYSISISPDLSIPPSQADFIVYLSRICSSFLSLVRVVSYVSRFLKNCKLPKSQRVLSSLTLPEIEQSKSTMYRLSQLQTFPEAFQKTCKPLLFQRGHPLHHFHVIKSEAGHLTALSRVRNPDSPNSPAELIVLSAKSELTKLLLTSLHHSYGHPGTSTLLTIISTSFIIIGARNFLKGVSRQCVTCQRVLAQPVSQVMGLLPAARTTPAPPFANTGVDFAGPVTLRAGHIRRPVLIKCYIAVFICMTTKAIHLELCESLSTSDFLATF